MGLQLNEVNLIVKSINLFILTSLALFPVFFINYELANLKTLIFMAFAITIVGVVFVDFLKINSLNSDIFHFFPNLNMRPRGFSLESSTLSISILTLGLLSAYYTKRRRNQIYILTLIVGLLVVIHSKGGIVTGLIVLGIIVIMYLHKTFKYLFLLTPVVLYFCYLVITKVAEMILIDIENFTSIATRGGLVLTSLFIVANNPFGVGFSGFLPAIKNYIPQAINYINNTFTINFNMTEITEMANSLTDNAISTKTFLFDYFIFFGIPFLIAFLLFNLKIISELKKTKSVFLLAAVLASFISVCTYIGGVGLYNISLVYGVALYEISRKNNIGCIT